MSNKIDGRLRDYESAQYLAESKTRFWAKVSRGPACWNWGGVKHPRGYGIFTFQGRTVRAHRFVMRDQIKSTDLVCHKCDNPSCVRPDHLFVGTHKVNTDDMMSKGRGFMRPGAENPNSLLTESDVMEIAQIPVGVSCRNIAAMYGVKERTIHNIRTGGSWTSVTGIPKGSRISTRFFKKKLADAIAEEKAK